MGGKQSEIKGVGVGLSTAESLSEALGGYLKVESNADLNKHYTLVEFGIQTISNSQAINFKDLIDSFRSDQTI